MPGQRLDSMFAQRRNRQGPITQSRSKRTDLSGSMDLDIEDVDGGRQMRRDLKSTGSRCSRKRPKVFMRC